MSTSIETNQPNFVLKVAETRHDKTFWTDIGVAYKNKDGSTNVILKMIPVNWDGRFTMFDYTSKKEQHAVA